MRVAPFAGRNLPAAERQNPVALLEPGLLGGRIRHDVENLRRLAEAEAARRRFSKLFPEARYVGDVEAESGRQILAAELRRGDGHGKGDVEETRVARQRRIEGEVVLDSLFRFEFGVGDRNARLVARTS